MPVVPPSAAGPRSRPVSMSLALTWTTIALLSIFVVRTAGLSCAPCQPELCKPVKSCKTGLVSDVCKCCQLCGKTAGDRCGGPWDVAGRCGQQLFCKKRTQHRAPYAEFNALGRCRAVSKARDLPRTDDVVFPDAEHVQQDEMERAERHQPGARSLLLP